MTLEIADIIIRLLANGLRVYANKRFIELFLDRKSYAWKHASVPYVIFWLATSFAFYMFDMPLLKVVVNLVCMFFVVIPYKAKISRKILIVLLVYGVNAMVDSVVVLSFVQYHTGNSLNSIYDCIISLLILFIQLLLERTKLGNIDVALPKMQKIALGIIPVISIGSIYYIVIAADGSRNLVAVVSVFMLVVNILIIYLYDSLTKFYSAHIEKKLLEQIIEVYSFQLDVIKESERKVKALRHDMKHHLLELSSMAKLGGNADMQNYLSEMGQFMLNPKEHISTGNKDIDGVVNYLLQTAKEILERVDIKVHIPEHLSIKTFKTCVIIGNLLDNAIREASKSQEKFLGVNIYTSKGVLYVYIQNSYAGTLVETGDTLQTTQEDLSIHGIGITNVRKIVELNGGDMEINYTKNWFQVSVMLYLSDI